MSDNEDHKIPKRESLDTFLERLKEARETNDLDKEAHALIDVVSSLFVQKIEVVDGY